MEYSVQIDAFEGPLDLLLHLINRYEIDMYDIPVAQITEQYLEFIHTMQELQLDIASEYLVMAATLLAIKSKMLLPQHEEDEYDQQLEMEMEEDPREELVRRLIEYRKYKEAANELKLLESDQRLTYSKQPSDLSMFESTQAPSNPLTNISIYDMVEAFQKVLNRKVKEKPSSSKIERQEIPIAQRMDEIVEGLLSKSTGSQRFSELFPYSTKEHVVVTFLAVLELMKVKKIRCYQEQNFQDIIVSISEGEVVTK